MFSFIFYLIQKWFNVSYKMYYKTWHLVVILLWLKHIWVYQEHGHLPALRSHLCPVLFLLFKNVVLVFTHRIRLLPMDGDCPGIKHIHWFFWPGTTSLFLTATFLPQTEPTNSPVAADMDKLAAAALVKQNMPTGCYCKFHLSNDKAFPLT